jgi:hypothetical protein
MIVQFTDELVLHGHHVGATTGLVIKGSKIDTDGEYTKSNARIVHPVVILDMTLLSTNDVKAESTDVIALVVAKALK